MNKITTAVACLISTSAALALAVFASGSYAAGLIETQESLQTSLQKRLLNDRTGVCMTVAIIAEKTIKATACADPTSPKLSAMLNDNTSFEIGSITKTMTATLLADLIERGQMNLDSPLADYLPVGTNVPSFEGKLILLRHVVTHTSGLPALPPDFMPTNANDPYANLTEKSLLASIGKVTLKQAPGETQSYSNFAMMLLSLAIANKAGMTYEALLQERIFKPLGMAGAYITDANKPKQVAAAIGHLPTKAVTAPWTLPVNLAGVGGVRATLPDMILYAKAQLGMIKFETNAGVDLSKSILKTQDKIPVKNGRPMGMNWSFQPSKTGEVMFHGGGTGGFSAELVIDKKAHRAVVVLADTQVGAMGSASQVALHLLNGDAAIGGPTIAMDAPETLLDALVGDYMLGDNLPTTLRKKGKTLTVQAAGQPEFEMGYDSRGDFYPFALDALLKVEKNGANYRLLWLQGGGAQPVKRVMTEAEKAVLAAARAKIPPVSAEDFERYVGIYNLAPNFDIKIFIESGKFYAQATNQPKFLLTPLGGVKFALEQVPADVEFLSADGVNFETLELTQNGRKNKARRVSK